jgi:hypothetical protein
MRADEVANGDYFDDHIVWCGCCSYVRDTIFSFMRYSPIADDYKWKTGDQIIMFLDTNQKQFSFSFMHSQKQKQKSSKNTMIKNIKCVDYDNDDNEILLACLGYGCVNEYSNIEERIFDVLWCAWPNQITSIEQI